MSWQRLNATGDLGFSLDMKDNIGANREEWMQPEGEITELDQS